MYDANYTEYLKFYVATYVGEDISVEEMIHMLVHERRVITMYHEHKHKTKNIRFCMVYNPSYEEYSDDDETVNMGIDIIGFCSATLNMVRGYADEVILPAEYTYDDEHELFYYHDTAY